VNPEPRSDGARQTAEVESSEAMRFHDFDALEAARNYANDVASESDEPAPVAVVVDGSRVIAR
jgi:hypothetical protein